MLRFFAVCFSLLMVVSLAYPWGSTGHRLINLKAPMHLPPTMADWRADSTLFQQHASDADNRKNSRDTSFWAEDTRHFIDIDWYPNYHQLPHSLDSMIALYGYSTVRDEGILPWAIVRELDSLTVWIRRGTSDSTAIQGMADLGHYVADAHQPLHCANNYDGQLTGNDGIHSRYESTMITAYRSQIVIRPDAIQYIADPLQYAFDIVYHSNGYVDSILAADNYAKAVSGWNGSGSVPAAYTNALWEKCGAFTIDQFQRATVALASLWYTAWVNAQPGPTVYDTITTIANGGDRLHQQVFHSFRNFPTLC